ncbi:hypothetical protein DM860_006980 [Cuscuta australis]|uniref:Uncharacterized protein n=1 Tax=Cuscuta australis TaxID=267555 RepID=A0A328E9F7_9ASTE|nr:hypothetical protein DM860_006980 [Cuscuta australis]
MVFSKHKILLHNSQVKIKLILIKTKLMLKLKIKYKLQIVKKLWNGLKLKNVGSKSHGPKVKEFIFFFILSFVPISLFQRSSFCVDRHHHPPRRRSPKTRTDLSLVRFSYLVLV